MNYKKVSFMNKQQTITANLLASARGFGLA